MNQAGKIVIIGPEYPLRGGIAAFNERLAREFIKFNYDTTIYTFSYQYPAFLFPGTTQYSTADQPQGLNIKVRINSVNPFNWLKIGNELRRLKPDLVVVRYWLPFMAPCLGTILRRIRKNKISKIVCIADNIQPHEKRPGDSVLTKYFIKSVDTFIVLSKEVKEQLRTFTHNKPVKLIPHPLYDHFGEIISQKEARKFLNVNPDIRLLLFFGFIRRYKGLDILLEAMKLLSKNPANHNLKLLIAGEFYEDEKNYKDLLNNPDISKHLILHTQFIPDTEVKYYLCAADCTIQPYRSATQSGVTPLSYYFEVPMIVTRVGGLPDMVPDHKAGLVAEPNAEDMAKKIEEYFSLGKEYFLPGLKEEKKKYSWDKMVEGIVSTAG